MKKLHFLKTKLNLKSCACQVVKQQQVLQTLLFLVLELRFWCPHLLNRLGRIVALVQIKCEISIYLEDTAN